MKTWVYRLPLPVILEWNNDVIDQKNPQDYPFWLLPQCTLIQPPTNLTPLIQKSKNHTCCNEPKEKKRKDQGYYQYLELGTLLCEIYPDDPKTNPTLITGKQLSLEHVSHIHQSGTSEVSQCHLEHHQKLLNIPSLAMANL